MYQMLQLAKLIAFYYCISKSCYNEYFSELAQSIDDWWDKYLGHVNEAPQ